MKRRIVHDSGGARILEGDDLLSHVRAAPGPTHGFFDVLAACAVALAPGPRVALLGFAGGGMLAPIRAMGSGARVTAVDWSAEGLPLFRRYCLPWAEPVRFAKAEASRWLRRGKSLFDAVIEDLSIPGPFGVTKPRVSLSLLPRLIRRRLAPGGVAVVNLLPFPGLPLGGMIAGISAPFPQRRVVAFRDYDNRILLLGRRLPDARAAGRAVRERLRAIGSRAVDRFSLRVIP